MATPRHALYGRGTHAISADEAGDVPLDRDELALLFSNAFTAPGYQPPVLPSTALELLAIARKPDVTFPIVARLLEKEPLIVSQVLRLAQSPVYRRAEPIRSLEQAASMLGLRALADLFLQASLSAKVFRAPGYEGPMTQLREHSIATAVVSRLVCRETSLSDDYAFLCGLLHDIGTAACIIVLAEEYGGRGQEKPHAPLEGFWPVIRDTHEQIALKLGEMWQLPADVRWVIGHHHVLAAGGPVHPLAAVVCVADSIATALGRGFELETDASQVARAATSLSLTSAQLEKVTLEARRLLSPT
jgi:putative nucleotidyltransferase with HDIG domain